MPETVMILGAGIFQLRIIERARRLGLVTHVVSIPGAYPGIKQADVFHPVDTTDIPSVVRLATNIRPRAIVTSGSDVCVEAMGAANDALGLAGISRSIAQTISHKDRFRQFQNAHGIPAPRCISASDSDELYEKLQELSLPVIVKPSDSSGSRGVSRLMNRSAADTSSAYELARRHSLRGVVCAEESLAGREVGGNALLWNGKIHFAAITAKHMDRFLVRGHHYPAELTDEQQRAVKAAVSDCCAALGYSHGPVNFDVFVNGTSATVIELGARLGGNGTTDLTERAFGYDIETEAIRVAMGQAPLLHSAAAVSSCGSLVFGSATNGILTNIASECELRMQCSELVSLTVRLTIGDTVPRMTSNADAIGYALFDLRNGSDWESASRRIELALSIAVRGGDR